LMFIKIKRQGKPAGVGLPVALLWGGLCGCWWKTPMSPSEPTDQRSQDKTLYLCFVDYCLLRINQDQGVHFTEECGVELSWSPQRERSILYLLRQSPKKIESIQYFVYLFLSLCWCLYMQ
jgi:hypothetical protein